MNYIIGEKENSVTGVSRYRDMIYSHLKEKVEFRPLGYTAKPLIAPIQRFFTYPRMVKKYADHGVTHITANQYAYLLDTIENGHSVVTVHNVFNSYMLENPENRAELRATQGRLSNWLFGVETRKWMAALKKATAVLADSEFTRTEVINRFHCQPERVRTIHLGVDRKEFRPIRHVKKPTYFGEKTILHVGSTTRRENPLMLINTFVALRRKIPNLKMVVIGTLDKGFQAMAAKKGIIGGITCVTNVPEGEMPIYYNSADLLVFPSLYEEFGLSPLEAMACGTPVVASNTTSIPEVVGDAGILKDTKDTKGFADAMYEILTDDGKKKYLVKKGLAQARRFPWSKTATETLSVYEEVFRT